MFRITRLTGMLAVATLVAVTAVTPVMASSSASRPVGGPLDPATTGACQTVSVGLRQVTIPCSATATAVEAFVKSSAAEVQRDARLAATRAQVRAEIESKQAIAEAQRDAALAPEAAPDR